jgi:hypothetical protein
LNEINPDRVMGCIKKQDAPVSLKKMEKMVNEELKKNGRKKEKECSANPALPFVLPKEIQATGI